METIQVVLGKPLLQAADRQARKTKVNRSALMRDALREHLQRVRQKELEEQDRRGYLKHPDSEAEALLWEKEAA
jgi:metal-responsive CopG/Arc/MetJ family transcriptional regulator